MRVVKIILALITLTLLVGFFGCKSKQKNVSLSKNKNEAIQSVDSVSREKDKSLNDRLIRNHEYKFTGNEFVMEIEPEGYFEVDKNGFKGEAKNVKVITRSSKKGIKIIKDSSRSETEKDKIYIKKTDTESIKETQTKNRSIDKKTAHPLFIIGTILALLIVMGIYLLLRKR